MLLLCKRNDLAETTTASPNEAAILSRLIHERNDRLVTMLFLKMRQVIYG